MCLILLINALNSADTNSTGYGGNILLFCAIINSIIADQVTTAICSINCGGHSWCYGYPGGTVSCSCQSGSYQKSATPNICIQWTVCDAAHPQVTVPTATSDTICDLCATDNNQCDHNCQSPGGTCSCNPSYDLDSDGKTCIFNNCYASNGGCSQVCVPDSGECKCRDDYQLADDGSSCIFNHCFYNNGGCEHECNGLIGLCTCHEGYDLQPNGLSCVYNHCYIENGGCQQICIPDSGECQCELDYDMEADLSSCIFNYCYGNNGGCDQYCDPRSGMCSCDKDYDLQAGVSCVFNNCYYENGGCAQICSPDVGTCSCENGFELESDAKSCLDIEPPSITCPAHIRVQRPDGPLTQNVSVSYALTYSDNELVTLVSCDLPSGSNFTANSTLVTCMVVDEVGLNDTCQFYVYLVTMTGPFTFNMNCSAPINFTSVAPFDDKIVNYLASHIYIDGDRFSNVSAAQLCVFLLMFDANLIDYAKAWRTNRFHLRSTFLKMELAVCRQQTHWAQYLWVIYEIAYGSEIDSNTKIRRELIRRSLLQTRRLRASPFPTRLCCHQ